MRVSITPSSPSSLPEAVKDPSLNATVNHPKLGRVLFFDPTNELTPLGQIPGYLQANFGLLVTPDGGELIELPKQPSSMNGIRRTAKLTLDATGKLSGSVKEHASAIAPPMNAGRCGTSPKLPIESSPSKACSPAHFPRSR